MPVVIRPCTKRAGYEALPTDEDGKWLQGLRIDLVEVSKKLVKEDCEVLEAGVLLVVKCLGLEEVTVYPSGRLMIKAKDEGSAMDAAKWVFDTIGLE